LSAGLIAPLLIIAKKEFFFSVILVDKEVEEIRLAEDEKFEDVYSSFIRKCKFKESS